MIKTVFLKRFLRKLLFKQTSAVKSEQMFRLTTFPRFSNHDMLCYSTPNPSLKYTEMKVVVKSY